MMYLIPKQLYSTLSQNGSCVKDQTNHTEVGSAGKVEIYNSCGKSDNCYGSSGNNGGPIDQPHNSAYADIADDNDDGLGSFKNNSSSKDKLEMADSLISQPDQRKLDATSNLNPSGLASAPLPPPPPPPPQTRTLPIVMPEQLPQNFQPQMPIIRQTESAVSNVIQDPVLIKSESVKKLIPDDKSLPPLPPAIQESHNIIKDMLIEERARMFKMLEEIKSDILKQQHDIAENGRSIMDGNFNINKVMNRMWDMINDNYSELQRSLEVQKGLIKEHTAKAETIQNGNSNMQEQFDSLGARLAVDIRQAFNPIRNQLEAEIASFQNREVQLWNRNFNSLRNDIANLNASQFQMLHDELKAHYTIWSRELQSEFRQRIEYDQQDWQRRLTMLVNINQQTTRQQFIDLRQIIMQTVTNIHYQFNRVEINIFDERFRQLEELLRQYHSNRSEQERAMIHEPPAQSSIAASGPQAALPAPSPQEALPAPSLQEALPAPAAQLELPEPPTQEALPAPDPIAALEGPEQQLQLPPPPEKLMLMPPNSSNSSTDDEQPQPGPSGLQAGVKDVAALESRVEKLLKKPTKAQVKGSITGRNSKKVLTRSRDQIRTRQVTKREQAKNKNRDV